MSPILAHQTNSGGIDGFENLEALRFGQNLWVGRLFTGLLVLIFLVSAVPSFAQTNISLPPEKFEMSAGGVDMRTGRYVYTMTDLAIGDPKNSGLALTRTLPSFVPIHTANPLGNFTHNWDVSIEIRNVDLNGAPTAGNLPPGNDFEAFVNYGGRTQTFASPLNAIGYGSLSKTGYFYLTFTGSRLGTNSVYTFTDSSGDSIRFQWLGTVNGLAVSGLYPTQITKPDGTTFTYAYTAYTDGTGNHVAAQSITSSFGYALLFEYSSGLITKACALNMAVAPLPGNALCPPGVQTVAYAYTGSNLTSVTDTSLKTWTFQYGTSGGYNTMGFIKPGQTTPWLVNTTGTTYDELDGAYDFVTDQSFVDGQAYHYTYEHPPFMTGRVLTKMGGTITDALGQKTTATYGFYALPRPTCSHPPCPPPTMGSTIYQITPGPTTIKDPLGNTTVNDYCSPATTAFCDVQLLQSTTSPEGIKSLPTFDNYNNVTSLQTVPKTGSSLPPVSVSATYDCLANPKACNKPTSTTDAKGKTTVFTYDPLHGGILTATGPADANGIQAVTRYAYVQRYAWISDGAGGYTHPTLPMWLLSTMKTCRATATNLSTDSCAGGASDEVVTVYEYGPDTGLVSNNLLLRGVAVTADTGGTTGTLRTCYAYDPQGRKISETKPSGTTLLPVCP